MRKFSPLPAYFAFALLGPAYGPDAGALERVLGMSRDARDVQSWLADEKRGEGLEAGGILWRPTIPLGLRYDGNVFASNQRDQDDGVFSFSPSVLGEADLGAHEISFYGYSRSDAYFDQGRQSNVEYGAGARGTFAIFQWLDATAAYRYDRLTEDWSSPDIPLEAVEAPELEQVSSRFGLHPRFGRFSSDLEFMYSDVTYDDLEVIGGGEISQANRNRDTVDIFVTLAYEFSEDFRPYVQLQWDDHAFDDWAVDRDGAGKNAFVGMQFETGTLRGDVYAGYVFQNLSDDDARLEEQEGFGFGVELDWELSDATRIRLDALRDIEEATTGLESGRMATTMLLRGAHRLSDRYTVEGRLGYEHDDYGGSPREEDSFSVQLGVTGEFAQNLYSQLSYRFTTRDSNVAGRSYDGSEVLWSVGWRR